jgi:hypothetical protein
LVEVFFVTFFLAGDFLVEVFFVDMVVLLAHGVK